MSPEQIKILSELYRETGLPLDRLPYSPEMNIIHVQLVAKTGPVDHTNGTYIQKQDIWAHLIALRKSGKLPGVGRKKRALQPRKTRV